MKSSAANAVCRWKEVQCITFIPGSLETVGQEQEGVLDVVAKRAVQHHVMERDKGPKYHSLNWADTPHERTDWYRKTTDAVIALSAGRVKTLEKLGMTGVLEYKEEYEYED